MYICTEIFCVSYLKKYFVFQLTGRATNSQIAKDNTSIGSPFRQSTVGGSAPDSASTACIHSSDDSTSRARAGSGGSAKNVITVHDDSMALNCPICPYTATDGRAVNSKPPSCGQRTTNVPASGILASSAK